MMDWKEEEQLNGKEDVEDRKTEEVEEPEKERVQPAEEQGEPEEKIHETAAAVETGDKVSGTVVRITEREVLVDIDSKSEGIIPLSELTIKQVDSTEDVLEEGDDVEAEVLSIDDEGTVYLSKREIDFDNLWERIQKDREEQNTVSARVTKRVKGGLVVDLEGLRGFVPGSHVGIGYIEDFEQFVGETLDLKIIEIERDENNIVLSRREVLEEVRAEEKEKTLAELEEGEIREGVVTGLVDFGAFVDIGGIDGLLHISEMAWGHIEHPSDILAEGDAIEVMVLDIDLEEERIALGLKQTLPSPWDGIADRFTVGDTIEAEITNLVSFGAFARIEEDIEGLIHISVMARRHIDKPEDIVSVGDEVKVKVLSINEEEEKISLSMNEVEQEGDFGGFETKEGGATIGDMVGEIFDGEDE